MFTEIHPNLRNLRLFAIRNMKGHFCSKRWVRFGSANIIMVRFGFGKKFPVRSFPNLVISDSCKITSFLLIESYLIFFGSANIIMVRQKFPVRSFPNLVIYNGYQITSLLPIESYLIFVGHVNPRAREGIPAGIMCKQHCSRLAPG